MGWERSHGALCGPVVRQGLWLPAKALVCLLVLLQVSRSGAQFVNVRGPVRLIYTAAGVRSSLADQSVTTIHIPSESIWF